MLLCAIDAASAHRFTVLYAFKGGNDGAVPATGVIADRRGYLYGTTSQGGGTGCSGHGCGTAFRLAPNGKESVLYSFSGDGDGATPNGLVRDDNGNLYGTTQEGGGVCAGAGCGTVFELAPDGTETVLHAFAGGSDGSNPQAGLLQDAKGDLFGTTQFGGAQNGGIVFKIRPDGREVILHAFCSQPNCTDGTEPVSPLVADAAGGFYGTTTLGGSAGNGTVFRLKKDGTESVLYNFCSQFVCQDGAVPLAGVTLDSAGNLYGTTSEGGAAYGTVFMLAPDGTETVLHSFDPGAPGGDGVWPHAGVVLDSAGNLDGSTYEAEAGKCKANESVVYRLAPGGTEALHCVPSLYLTGGVTEANGVLYGTGNASAKAQYQYGFVFAFRE